VSEIITLLQHHYEKYTVYTDINKSPHTAQPLWASVQSPQINLPPFDGLSSIKRACIRTYLKTYEIDRQMNQLKQEFVRPRWPYDMRPSARAEKYMCVIVIR